MARKFRNVDYEKSLDQTVTIRAVLPPDHLAHFIAQVIALLDLSAIYAHYAPVGGEPYAPEVLLGLLLYGYVTGVFSSRKIERATYESIPFRFLSGGWHPDHDTIANFRRTFLAYIVDLFTQVLVIAHELGELKLIDVSVDGSKIHADASKSHAVSYGRLLVLEERLRQEVEALLALGEQADQGAVAMEMDIAFEIELRQKRMLNLEQAKAVLEARAQERDAAEQAAYEAKMQEREEKTTETGRRPRGPAPKPPTATGPRKKDQYNFTDPDSRIMKNSTNQGFDQHYNVQVAVDHESRLIVGHTLSNHPTDRQEAIPTLTAIPSKVGQPEKAALDNGYWSPANVAALEALGIEPYIATGRDHHHQSWHERFAAEPDPPAQDASPLVKMAYKLRTDIGKLIYRLRKSTVEPVIGIIKEVLGFRQFSLRGLEASAGEWGLVCLAYNLKRLHVLLKKTWPDRVVSLAD
jgi:transposase